MDKIYTVYMHVNKINDKKYIGITCIKPERRWFNGDGYKHSPYFYKAISKHGWDNFEHAILFNGLTKEESEKMEIQLISEYKTTNREFGYNIRSGGNTCLMPEESKIKMSIARKGKYIGANSPCFGKHPSLETRKKMSLVNTGKHDGEDNNFFGRTHSEKSKKKMREIKIGENNSTARSVININTGKIFPLTKYGALFFNIYPGHITRCCRGKLKSAGKHPQTGEPLRWMYYEEYLKLQAIG
jgi:group I intron endonuclease